MQTRRSFLKKAALTGAMLGFTDIISSAMEQSPSAKKITLHENDIILLQGDSITDAHRNKKSDPPNTFAMTGNGYPIHAAGALLCQHAEKHLTIYNKGVSGNKVFQLAERWDKDCIELKPNVVSILVGVNDFWHTIANDYQGTAAIYENDYRTLLQRTKDALPGVKLIIGEPYAINGVKAVDDSWFPAFNEYRSIARKIAAEFDAVFIPFQKVFDEAQKRVPASYWTLDGIHVALPGSYLMANAWLQAFK
jgi:lysophospholipase L1-like esterase